MSIAPKTPNPVLPDTLTAVRVASAPVDEVLGWLDCSAQGLSSAEVSARRARYGPNAVRTHHVKALAVLGRQLRSAVLILLAATAVVSYFLGDSLQAIIIGVILAASIGLGFINEYRAERAAAALHSGVRHTAVARRDGAFIAIDVTELVPGDVIRLSLGEVVPADLRLIEVTGPPEYPAGSRVTACRSIPICGRCGSDETFESMDEAKGIGWGLSSAGCWPLPIEVIDERCARYHRQMRLAILTADGHVVTEDGSTPVTNPRNTGGWAQYGKCEAGHDGDD